MTDMTNKENDISLRRSQLSSEKQAMLKKRVWGALLAKTKTLDISRLTRRDLAPLSFAQQSLWFLDQLTPDSPMYNIPLILNLTGQLNVDALEQSLNEIVQRHEALRTTFVTVDGHPQQMISSQLPISLLIVNLENMADAVQKMKVRELINEEAQKPFDLARGPLIRTVLLQLSKTEYILLLTIHHIVFDGWSISILLKDLAALYEAFLTRRSLDLPELPIQYIDYAVWQRQWLQGHNLHIQIDYWRQRLSNVPSLLELPIDYPRLPQQSFQGANYRFALPKPLLRNLRYLGQREGVTLFMTLLAAFQTLLYRYTGQEDIIVGTPIAGRTREETEGLIGFFVNTLVLRTDFSGNPSFRNLLSRVREVALGAFAHQELPFERLVEELRPERNLSYNPLFQVMFVLQNALTETIHLSDLSMHLEDVDSETAKFDITFEVLETPNGLNGKVEYNTNLFKATTIMRMVENWRTLLESIAIDPEQSISSLQLLSKAEQQKLIEWNQTTTNYPKDRCIHQLFEEQVNHTPEAIATCFKGEQLSYQELNRRANQLAHYLQQLGVGPEVLVGFYVERSLEMVVGLLGILKAGGAYVPLDLTHPLQRLIFMLEDAQFPVLLTQKRLIENLSAYTAHVICLDTEWEIIAHEDDQNPISEVKASDMAYVIYTSGSTGKPKGVQVEHSGLVNYLSWAAKAYGSAEAGSFPLYSSLAFDLTITSLFLPLLTGNTILIQSSELNGADLVTAIAHVHDFQSAKFTPAHIELLIQDAKLNGPGMKNLRHIIVGGEALSPELVKTWFIYYPQTILYNEYGPTEAVVGCVVHKMTSIDAFFDRHTVPIGRPIANTRIWILSAQQQIVPIGVKGEIYISGAGIARGYLNHPHLTAERFIEHPSCPGERLYKTGDIALYRDNGVIEYCGRTDYQVKIRSFRIELGEIETVLARHPVVQECVLLVREDVQGEKRLIAYVVPTHDQALSIYELRNFLKKLLPDYMVPSAFMMLETLPLTPNGKIDRSALPYPDQEMLERNEAFMAPRTSIEEILIDIWSQVLKIKQISVRDDFFALGGHSLLATQIISRIRERFHTELPLRYLFEAPTIADLALIITQSLSNQKENRFSTIHQATQRNAEQILANLNQLSDEEVDALLNAMSAVNESSE